MLPAPDRPYAVPVYVEVKVHRDYHVQIDRALYSLPEHLLGQQFSARADEELVKLFYRGQLVKTHPRQPAGGRSTDPADLPAEKTAYAMRDVARLVATAAAHGTNVGIYAERLLDHDLPWTKMRQVYRLLSLVERYGAGPTDTACGRALTSTSSRWPRSPPCWRKPPRTPRHRRRGRLAAWRRRGLPATPPNTRSSGRTG